MLISLYAIWSMKIEYNFFADKPMGVPNFSKRDKSLFSCWSMLKRQERYSSEENTAKHLREPMRKNKNRDVGQSPGNLGPFFIHCGNMNIFLKLLYG